MAINWMFRCFLFCWVLHLCLSQGVAIGGSCISSAQCVENASCIQDFYFCLGPQHPIMAGVIEICSNFTQTPGYSAPACIGKPGALQNLQFNQIISANNQTVNFTFSWDALPVLGPMTVQAYFKRADAPQSSLTVSVDGDEVHMQTEVLGGKNYSAVIYVYTPAGVGPVSGPVQFTSLDTIPNAPMQVEAIQDSVYANRMTLRVSRPRESNGMIRAVVVKKTYEDDGNNMTSEHVVTITGTQNEYANPIVIDETHVGGIVAGREYHFEVKLRNSAFDGPFSSPTSLMVRAKVPLFSGQHTPTKLLSRDSQQSVSVKICASCIVDSSQGAVTAAALIVCFPSASLACPNSNVMSATDLDTLETWASAKAKNFNVAYRATPASWLQELQQANVPDHEYSIGSMTCNPNDTSTLCDGPLPSEREFSVTIVACTNGGCDQVTKEDFDTFVDKANDDDDDDDDESTIIGLAVALGIVCFLLLVLVIFVIVRMQRSADFPV